MRKMRLNAIFTAPVFPLFFKLRSMIRQNSLRKPLLPLQHRYCFSRRELMIKLLRRYNEAAVIVDADQKPVLLALNRKWTLKVYLPQLIRRLCPKELPALKLTLIPILIIPCKNIVYGFSGELYSLNAMYRIQHEGWQLVEALLYASGSPFEGSSQFEDREFNFDCDFAFFGLSGFVFEGFCSTMLASCEPSIHGLS